MTQALVHWWNGDAEFQDRTTALGLRLLEADDDHALAEIQATSFNKLRGYFSGVATLGVVEMVAGTLASYSDWVGVVEGGDAAAIGWTMNQLSTNFTGNTRRDTAVCESRWALRGETESIITTEIRSGARVILYATSTHVKR